jgi:glycosyltransferase involved in cell wall biosynthesis
MKIAIVHDYLNEYGGAERVLQTLSEMYPEAPIYTAFAVPGSSAQTAFRNKNIITSWFNKFPFYNKLYSPLRFLIPWIWKSFDLSQYDLIISSASWYITKGFGNPEKRPIEICYCHTPPRWLYGYETSINWQKWWIVRVYALIVGHFLRMYDFYQAQKVDVFLANSKNVANRIRKFYRREAEVVYPPVKLPITNFQFSNNTQNSNSKLPNDYYLMVTRIVGGKGIEMAVEAAKKVGFKLVIAGERAGYSKFSITNDQLPNNVRFLNRVSEEEKIKLMSGARAFLALSKDEDFGITPVESQMRGVPVIAFNGGGYRETVIEGGTGVLFEDYSADGLIKAMEKFNKIKWDKKVIRKNAEKFSEERFKKEIKEVVNTFNITPRSPLNLRGEGKR